ncbi:MAG: DNA repair protein RecO, partial [Nitrospinota bacterium]
MPLYSTDAIVLKSINLGEADKIVTLFTQRYGKIKGVAKGARRVKSRFGASLEPLTYSNLIYFGKENTSLYKINSCDILEPFSKCKGNFDRLKRALFLSDFINSALRELDVNARIFELSLNTLRVFDKVEETRRLDIYLDIFALRFLSASGFSPKLTNCISCSKTSPLLMGGGMGGGGDYRIGFNILKGGIVCSECLNGSEDVIRISSGIINFMKKAISMDVSNLGRLNLSHGMERELHKIIRDYIRAHMHMEIKSYD